MTSEYLSDLIPNLVRDEHPYRNNVIQRLSTTERSFVPDLPDEIRESEK